MTVPLVALKDVSVRAGGQLLLDRVTFDLQPGEAVQLQGPNGSGKTTLLRLLAGQVAPYAGSRTYALKGETQHSAVRARRVLSVVGPDAEAFYLTRDWAQTVRDVLLAGYAGESLNLWEADPLARQRLQEVLDWTGLEPWLDRDFRTLSHGQRRRVLLARALMTAPECLLLDEWTDGLSPTARAELGELLRNLHLAGTAIVLASHRPDEAPAVPWRTIYMEAGRISTAAPQPSPRPTTSDPTPFPAPRHSASTLVRLNAVEVFRNGQLALGPLSWTWEAGQHWLVTGANGSGKSTLARLIAGELFPAVGGSVERPYLKRDTLAERRRSVGLVSVEVGHRQRSGPSGLAWTGREVLASAFAGTEGFTGEVTPEQGERVEALARHMELEPWLDRTVDTLSQGQWRRLLLARAVVHCPTLLLLDEGWDFLDARSRGLFSSLLPALQRNGTHLMVIAHREADVPPGLTHHLHLQGGLVSREGRWQRGEWSDSPHLDPLA